MRWMIFIAALFASRVAFAAPFWTIAGTVTPAPAVYLVSEDCEGVGTPAGWTNSGTISWDYATTPAPLVGFESVALSSTSAYTEIDFGADQSDVWVFVRAYSAGWIAANNLELRNSGGTVQAYLDIRSDRYTAFHGTAGDSHTGVTPNAVPLVVWIHYVAQSGGGGNGVLAVYHNDNSTSEVRPALIDPTVTTGTGGAVRRLRIATGATANIHIFDKIRVSASEIGSSPP